MFLLLLFFIFYFFALKHVLHRLENATVLQLTETKPQFKEETSAPYLLANSSTQANTVKLWEVKRNVMIQSFGLKNNSPNSSDNILVWHYNCVTSR